MMSQRTPPTTTSTRNITQGADWGVLYRNSCQVRDDMCYIYTFHFTQRVDVNNPSDCLRQHKSHKRVKPGSE